MPGDVFEPAWLIHQAAQIIAQTMSAPSDVIVRLAIGIGDSNNLNLRIVKQIAYVYQSLVAATNMNQGNFFPCGLLVLTRFLKYGNLMSFRLTVDAARD